MAQIKTTMSAPRPKIEPFSFHDFSGGLNNKTEIMDNQARALLNMDFASDQKIEKRKSFAPNRTVLAHGVATSTDIPRMHNEYKPYVGNNQDVVVTDLNIYINNIAQEIAGVKDGLTFMNQYWFVNGEFIWVYDGMVTRKLINPEPADVPNPSPATTGEWLYDDASNPRTVRYSPCQFELDSEYLGTNLIPEKPSIIAAKGGRLFISGCEDDPNNVYISDIDNGGYWAVTLPVQPEPNGETVTALVDFMDVMIIGRTESIYAVYGNTNIETINDDIFRVKRVQTHSGIMNNRTIARMHNHLVFLGSDSIVYTLMTPNTDVRYITTQVLSKGVDLYKAPLNFTYDELANSFAVFCDDKYYLKINNYTMVYSYVEMAWTVYDLHEISAFYNNNGILDMCFLVGPDPVLYIMNWVLNEDGEYYIPSMWDDETGYIAGGVDIFGNPTMAQIITEKIPCFWTSKRFDFGSATYYKHFRELFAVVATYIKWDSWLNINFEIDFLDIGSLVEIKDKVAVWGRAAFGDRFIDKDIAASIPTQIGRRGRYMSFTISNNEGGQPMRLHEIAGDYILRGRRS